ncbi:MAG: flagellar biosynthesis protein FlhB [Planctomycetota bacterium]|nr:MAG: flagellar biosynthesis protein FlhB [Planctomycetota bacterium]
MAENQDFGERTEQATPRKRQEVRERGQVARSADLATACVLLGIFISLWLFGNVVYNNLQHLNRTVLGNISATFTRDEVWFYALAGLLMCLKVMLPIILVAFVLAFLANVIQVGWVFSTQPLIPDLNRINPVSGFKRIFSLRSLVRLFMSITKITVVSAVLVATIWSQIGVLFSLFQFSVNEAFLTGCRIVWLMGLQASLALLVLAVLDYLYQRWQFEREIRMTKQELKDELKKMEGDPKIKERRRMLQRQLALQRMMAAVPKADVVVTNPTEIAVALGYDDLKMEAPTVIAKGKEYVAERIRRIAKENGIPIVEKRPLAQALFKMCEVGDTVPPDLYQAVAELLAYVYELSGKRAG